MIIGTAGHIDHGKTTLVQALTGVDTDRLKEEKSRGISIELGYAYTPLANGDILGFIDVPGHERLIHTMTAGASGIDFGLLVVAADDGVMPQTREHLAILSLLGIQQGAVAVTKADRVGTERLVEVQQEVSQLVGGTFLEDRAIFNVSATATDDPGLLALRTHLHDAAQALHERSTEGLFRLAVDRSFSLKGHGTVVTGTVYDGVLPLNDDSIDLRLMPSGQKLRVRSIHAQNQAAQQARVGQRCALNLSGIEKEAIARGDWVADARCFVPSRNIDVHLQLLPDTDTVVRTWSPLHVHIGASHYVAHAVPLSTTQLAAGEQGWVQLVFTEPVCAMSGDRYIVRDAQAQHTIGGGVVLDPNAPQRKRRTPARMAWLQALYTLGSDAGLQGVLQQAQWGLDEHDATRLTGRSVHSLALPDQAFWVGAKSQQVPKVLILQPQWDALVTQVLQTLQQFHENWPDEPGVNAARLKRMALPTAPEPLWAALCDTLLEQGQLSRNGPWLHIPGHAIRLNDDELRLAERILPLVEAGGFNPPWVRDVAHSLDESEDVIRHVLLKLLRRGDVYQVVRDLFYHHSQVSLLAEVVADVDGSDGMTAAEFRDRIGIGRKRSIQILEFFNRAGYTRRLRDRHVVFKGSAEVWQRLS